MLFPLGLPQLLSQADSPKQKETFPPYVTFPLCVTDHLLATRIFQECCFSSNPLARVPLQTNTGWVMHNFRCWFPETRKCSSFDSQSRKLRQDLLKMVPWHWLHCDRMLGSREVSLVLEYFRLPGLLSVQMHFISPRADPWLLFPGSLSFSYHFPPSACWVFSTGCCFSLPPTHQSLWFYFYF